MRILIDASICSVGGGVQVALSLLNNIVLDNSFEVICVASPQVDSQLSLETKNQFFKYFKEKNVSILKKRTQGKRLSKIEAQYNPDLVFVVFGPSYWRPKALTLQGFALPLLVYPETRNKIYKKNLVSYFYQKLLNHYKAIMTRQNSDYIVVETQTFKNRVHEKLGIPLDKIFVIENSFNSNFISPSNKADHVVEGVNDNVCASFFVPSAYYPHKNLEVLINVAKELKLKKFKSLKFNFLINKNSKEWVDIITKAKTLGVEDYFHTYGVVNNTLMKFLYEKNQFIILPTLAEASTAVYPETFVSGKVLFTSDLDFARELCGNAAVFFDPYDPKDIADKIIGTVNDPNLQKSLVEWGGKQMSISYVTPEQKWQKQKQLILSLIRVSK